VWSLPLQGLRQAAAAADGHEGHPEELRRLPEAQELAVVEAVHQGNHHQAGVKVIPWSLTPRP